MSKSSEEKLGKISSQWKIFDKIKTSSKILNFKSEESSSTSGEKQKHGVLEVSFNNCNCCGTILTYPSIAQKYRCSVCNMTNIMGEIPKTKESPHRISYKYVKLLIDSCFEDAKSQAQNDELQTKRSTHEIFEPLSTYLFSAFSSRDCLNKSFRIDRSVKKLHYSSPNIDLDNVRACFNLLTKLPTKRPLYNALLGASEVLKRFYVSMTDNAMNLLYVIIIFEIPFFNRALIHTKQQDIRSMVDVPEIREVCFDILKRVLGILSSINGSASDYIASWFANLPERSFTSKVDLINLYITFHLKNYYHIANNPRSVRNRSNGNPLMTASYPNDGFELNATSKNEEQNELNNRPSIPLIGRSKSSADSKSELKIKIHQYGNDWHLKTASVVLGIFVKANSIRSKSIAASSFYNSLVDYVNMKLDFDSWQNKKNLASGGESEIGKLQNVIEYIHGTSTSSNSFFFCSFPFLLSLGAKILILEYEARRQMERKAEEAFINSLDKRVAIDIYFRVKVRREAIVQDSLRCIQLNQSNLKKSLRVSFVNEPGIDVGGLKKEWFLLLSKALFTPSAGMLVNIEDSNLLWFSIKPVENFEMYYLFGAVLGLAIYNSTILDLRFPLALYRILLGKSLSLSDYEQLFPISWANLSKIKEFTADALDAMDLTFEVTYSDPLGKIYTKNLIPKGATTKVTIHNRNLYVQKYAMFFMCEGIQNQIQSFTRGFTNVAGGNGLSLFLAEEIQLLICGSEDSKLDIDIMRSVTKYVGWKDKHEAMSNSTVQWFWEYMEQLSLPKQKKFLLFVTGSDRVPATGIQNLSFRISKAGKDSNRLPIAHTCFNELALYMYSTREKLFSKLNLAMNESAGFGIK